MKIRLTLAAAAIASAGMLSAVMAPGAFAATTTSAPASGVTSAAATAVTTATSATVCTDGHWPASVQGEPTAFHAGAAGGDYIWHDSAGWHVRVTHTGDGRVVFTGRIVSSTPLVETPVLLELNDSVTVSANREVITYRLVNYGGVDGFDFVTNCAQHVSFGGYWGGVRLPVTRIWTGAGNLHPLENPFVVTRLLIP
jgi:hypothetical protein